MKFKSKKIFFGTVALTTSVWVLIYEYGKYLVKIAMDRNVPRNLERKRIHLKSNKAWINFFDVMKNAGETLEKSDYEDVEITAYDGTRLVGHWKICKDPKRIIVAMHGWRSSWCKDFGIIAEFWEKSGCHVLYAEQRGQNKSDGDYIGFGLLERHDCFQWIQWVNRRNEEHLPIYLGGASMGATTVLMCAGMDLPKEVHGIVADCGFTSPDAIWKHVMKKNLHLPYCLYKGTANGICKKKINCESNAYSTLEAMDVCNVPVLFIHGSEDNLVPVEMSYENYKICKAPKQIFIVPGADHGMSYYIDKENYEKILLEFWRKYD